MNEGFLTRIRMTMPLAGALPPPTLPEGFFWVPWDDALLSLHAEVHFRAFADCIDRRLFASFQDRASCYWLLREIRGSTAFFPEGTCLVGHAHGCCGTIQCSVTDDGIGAIQNIGVMPAYRGQGLGLALVLFALNAFQKRGLSSAGLEVTAENTRAVKLYERLGFTAIERTQRATLESQIASY